MKLTPKQLYSLGFSILVILILLFGFNTKPKELLDLEKSRALNLQSTDVSILINEASKMISGNDKTRIQILEAQLSEVEEEQKSQLYKDLSSVWYNANEVGIAGHYAEQAAILEGTASSWAIAGTTYALCIKRTKKDKERVFCLDKSLEAIEKAISIDPDNIGYQINRAVILAENPPADNPMIGVQQLLNLNKKFPKNVSVINNIAKFAIQTNQLDRAEQRLLGALTIEPDNSTTICLLAQLYMAKGDENKAMEYQARCRK